ncbi:MAG TPA: CDP-alcohol phosphatidyltransferase family protein, partial [Thermoleophilaceae bacterium]
MTDPARPGPASTDPGEGDRPRGGAGRARAGAGGSGARRTPAEAWSQSEIREQARNKLIESRLTPNAISVTGFVGNVIAAVLVTQRYFFLGGVAFVLGSVMDTLDGRYSRMSGKGTPF